MYKVGDKIYFASEKRPYTIQACDERYLICTKPFNLQHTVQYTIIDLKLGIRGADNYWKWGGRFDYSKREECERCLLALYGKCFDSDGERVDVMISYRNQVELDIREE